MWGRLGNTSGEAIYVTRGTTAADLGSDVPVGRPVVKSGRADLPRPRPDRRPVGRPDYSHVEPDPGTAGRRTVLRCPSAR